MKDEHSDKRKNLRERTLWKVNMVDNQEEKFIGYLMNLSTGGAKFYIDNDHVGNIKKEFNIKIKPPYEVELEVKPCELPVKIVWQRETHFLEIGVKFVDDSNSVSEYVFSLLEFFNSDKKKTFETEIIN